MMTPKTTETQAWRNEQFELSSRGNNLSIFATITFGFFEA